MEEPGLGKVAVIGDNAAKMMLVVETVTASSLAASFAFVFRGWI